MQGLSRRTAEEAGFTLIELLISIVVIGLIASGVAAGIILFFTTTDGTSNRLALSHDSQLLATYLVPDLDSLTGAAPAGQPSVTPSSGGGSQSCPSGGVAFTDLQVQSTDLSSQQPYLAEYKVNGSEITRTSSSGGPVTVVHNLKPGTFPVCASSPPNGTAPWTVTVTTETNGDTIGDYTFSVTGGGRVVTPTPPGGPTLCGPPNCVSAPVMSISVSTPGLSDEVVVTFDQPLNVNDLAGVSEWQLMPPGVTLQSVQIQGNQAILLPTSPFSADGLSVKFTPKPNGIRNATNQPALPIGGPYHVTNAVAPALTSMVSHDTNGNGKVDQVVVTFSEVLAPSTNTAQWTLTGQPPGVTLNSVAVSGSTATLTLNQGTTVDTIAAGFQVALAPDPTGIRNADGYPSSFPATAVADGMAPVPLPGPGGIVSQDTFHTGKANRIVVTFSESLVSSTNAGPWSLSGQPAGITLNSVSVSGNTATLVLTGGIAPDTAATGMQISLAADPSGVRSATTGNVASFGPAPVSDGMSPLVVALSSTNGGTAGRIETGDTLTLTFSERLAGSSIPSSSTITLTPAAGGLNDKLQIAGLATIDLGVKNGYVTNSSATFNATLSNVAGVVTVTVGANTSGAGNVLTEVPVTMMKVTPAVTITDLASPANAAVGAYNTTNPMVLC